MKINKIHLAILLMLSILSVEWTPNYTGVPVAIEKNVRLTLPEFFPANLNNYAFGALLEKNLFINDAGITLNYTKLKLTKEKYNQLPQRNDIAPMQMAGMIKRGHFFSICQTISEK